ncbi:hypothetical protein ES703_111700 [subsurface metagenome]
MFDDSPHDQRQNRPDTRHNIQCQPCQKRQTESEPCRIARPFYSFNYLVCVAGSFNANLFPRITPAPIEPRLEHFLKWRQTNHTRTSDTGNLDSDAAPVNYSGLCWSFVCFGFHWHKDGEMAGVDLDFVACQVCEDLPFRKEGLAKPKIVGLSLDLQLKSGGRRGFCLCIIVEVISSFEYDRYAGFSAHSSRLEVCRRKLLFDSYQLNGGGKIGDNCRT